MTSQQEWEMTPLGMAADIVMGQSPDSKFYSAEEVGLPFLQGCAEFANRFPRHKLFCSQNRKLASVGSILFSVRAPVGKLNIADRDYIIGRGLASISGTVVATRYLEHFLQFEEGRLRVASQGSTFEAINSTELAQWHVVHPKNQYEQTKIAEILSTVDEVIEQTEALIAKQQRIKSGLMQDLLTRGIDKDGNLRSEDTHEFKDSPLGRIPLGWDVKELKHLARIVTGNKDTQNRNDSADYPFFVRSQQVERIGSYTFDGEAVLTAGDGVGTGKVFHYTKGKFDFHQRVYCLHSFDSKVDGFFFFNFFQTNFRDRVAQFSAKGSVDSVRLAMIADMLIPLPDLEEQRRSAAIFRQAETVLSEYRKRSEKLTLLKTALMQDLLTGKVSAKPLLTEAEISI